ncbi:benzaldehyde dehydrogenase [Paracidovorax wautersii]|uniref:Benzaldehyde dehydrogenase (NAD) n=1 Tax=Paracidovorax wautersii TaxID=1177982 RepID=A0ABU1I590_9BURK|nr:benzaldehyde dehydrogenase [Paracidovorax wautersii]MDR6212392.1 benzaldehyde dehydrogenase (NAD) [Paracidovorax wautersii]
MAHVPSFLTPHQWQQHVYVGGWRPSHQKLEIVEPATGKRLATTGLASVEDVAQAAALAQRAQQDWAAQHPRDRAAVLHRAAALLQQHHDELSLWVARETGGVLPKGQHEVRESVAFCLQSAAMPTQSQGQVLPSVPGRLSLARRMPHGVISVISPFNFPLILSLRVVAAALATGNAVLVKPDPRTPISGGHLLAQLFEAAGLPPGLLSVLPGGADVGEALVTAPEVSMVSFTGSVGVGRRVGELAARHLKKVSLELGGTNSLVILDDADLDLAASNAAWGAWQHQGQICMASNRVLVHESIAPALLERLVAKANHMTVGDGATGQVSMGPLIDARQRDRVHHIVQEAVQSGAQLLAGGTYEGLFYRPTVLTGTRLGMRVHDEEVFGPVLSLNTFRSDEEAAALANAHRGGLSAGVITRSLNRGLALAQHLRAGMVHVNDQTVNDDVVNPFGGPGVAGNGSVHGGPADWEAFTVWRWLTVKDAPPAYPV